MRVIKRLTSCLDSWDEMCVDEHARHRTNTILSTFATTIFFLIMFVVNVINRHAIMVLLVVILGIIAGSLCFLQARDRRYRPWISWGFGVMALCMSAFLIYSGGGEGYSYLWVFIVPIIAVMVVSFIQSIIYNVIFMALILVLLQTPAYTLLRQQYTVAFRFVYPIAMLFVILCIYITETTRYRTHRQLALTAEKLQSFAFTDPLTRVYNRHAMTSHFHDLNEDAHGLSFAMMDLDFFKQINDTYGHIVGDQVLCHVVGLVNGCIPPGSFLYRWGGEEFLLIVKSSKAEEVGALLEQICATVRTTPLELEEERLRCTISIGGMTAPSDAKIKDCISQVDEYLYRAKENGRDRVVFQGQI